MAVGDGASPSFNLTSNEKFDGAQKIEFDVFSDNQQELQVQTIVKKPFSHWLNKAKQESYPESKKRTMTERQKRVAA